MDSVLIPAMIGLLGAVAGNFVNWAIYSLSYFNPRGISPWSRAPAGRPRTIIDYLPIVGWLSLRREADVWGRGFWIRPLLIELALAVGLAWLYQAEINGFLLPSNQYLSIAWQLPLWQFASHTILILLMTVATFIDFDEQMIPDAITTPGTLLGLALMATAPGALPHIEFPRGVLQPLWLTTTHGWPAWLDQWPGLVLGIACFTGWCYALAPKIATLRRGWWRGWLYLHASTYRHASRLLLAIAALGIILISGVWSAASPGQHWQALLTSLVGMACGGALVWAVRIVGFLGLRKEAMGFGDVTLMAMIGAFLGWQSTILVFFLAPLVAVVIAVTQWLLTRRHDIAFGPYLCGAALILIVQQPWLWERYGATVFEGLQPPWLVPALIGCCLALMLGLLILMRVVREAVTEIWAK